MPKELVKSDKSKGLSGGGKGGTKGTGVVQSVLDLQKQIGNDQTVKTVLGPDVASQFSALASKGTSPFHASTQSRLPILLSCRQSASSCWATM